MNAKNGKIYNNYFERAGAFYASTCAPREEGDGKADVREIMLTIYGAFAQKSEEIGLKTNPDVFFNPWEPQKGREKDVKLIRGANEKIMEFQDMLLSFMELSTWKDNGLYVDADQFMPKKIFFKVLDAAGITYTKGTQTSIILEKECAMAFKELAEHTIALGTSEEGKVNHSVAAFYFSRAVFDDKKDWLADDFDEIMGAKGYLAELCKTLEKMGFRREILLDGRYFSLNYLKDFGKKPEPLKRAFGERTRLGIEISYEDICINPALLSLRMPYYVDVLNNADRLTNEVRLFTLSNTKTCDGCRYCVQTDKTGKRPLANISVGGVKKCPYYPAFSYRFIEMDKSLEENIINFLEDVEQIYEKRG
ncbi:MAG TPA: hypothetical protein VJY54_14445 [Lachnospiraceae bacterium]|nr:hypothetical protein [Lachnospiraceae bacterium]